MSLQSWRCHHQDLRERERERRKIEIENAEEHYKLAEDNLSRVRLLCFQGKIEDAATLVDSTQDAAASYQLARHYESQNQPEAAIKYFSMSG